MPILSCHLPLLDRNSNLYWSAACGNQIQLVSDWMLNRKLDVIITFWLHFLYFSHWLRGSVHHDFINRHHIGELMIKQGLLDWLIKHLLKLTEWNYLFRNSLLLLISLTRYRLAKQICVDASEQLLLFTNKFLSGSCKVRLILMTERGSFKSISTK